MSHTLIWEPKGVYWKYTQQVSGEEITETSKSIYRDPRFKDLQYKLVDFLDVETIEMDKKDIIRIACQHRSAVKFNRNIKSAIVLKSKTNKLANKFTELFKGSSWEVQVFQNLDDANNWLGRKPPF